MTGTGRWRWRSCRAHDWSSPLCPGSKRRALLGRSRSATGGWLTISQGSGDPIEGASSAPLGVRAARLHATRAPPTPTGPAPKRMCPDGSKVDLSANCPQQVNECYTFPFIKGGQAYQAPFIDKCQHEYKGTIKCDGTFEGGKLECCCTYFK
jgi:hypothetical protein